MKLSITKMSDYASGIIKKSKNGAVHSVYRKTINLSLGKELIALQAKNSPLSPISLVTELSAHDMELLSIKAGTPVRLSASQIEICSPDKSCVISCAGADRHNLLLRPVDAAQTGEVRLYLAESINVVLSGTKTGGFDSIFYGEPERELSLILLTAKKIIRECEELYRQQKYQKAASRLTSLIGLGGGLTPGGDDFLCGVLAGLTLTGQENHEFCRALREGINSRLSDTVDISAAFLSCALKGQYSLAVNTLRHKPAPGEILSMFSKIGHSSGIDTLCGVLYALKL